MTDTAQAELRLKPSLWELSESGVSQAWVKSDSVVGSSSPCEGGMTLVAPAGYDGAGWCLLSTTRLVKYRGLVEHCACRVLFQFLDLSQCQHHFHKGTIEANQVVDFTPDLSRLRCWPRDFLFPFRVGQVLPVTKQKSKAELSVNGTKFHREAFRQESAGHLSHLLSRLSYNDHNDTNTTGLAALILLLLTVLMLINFAGLNVNVNVVRRMFLPVTVRSTHLAMLLDSQPGIKHEQFCYFTACTSKAQVLSQLHLNAAMMLKGHPRWYFGFNFKIR